MSTSHRPGVPVGAALFVAAVAVACHSRATELRTARAAGEGRVITQEQIRRSGATNAWDALRRNGVMLSFRETQSGQPAQMRSRRGSSSLLNRSADVPLLVVDGSRISDPRMLVSIPASAIDRIQILDGMAGTIYQGTGAGAGVIIVYTRTAPNP